MFVTMEQELEEFYNWDIADNDVLPDLILDALPNEDMEERHEPA